MRVSVAFFLTREAAQGTQQEPVTTGFAERGLLEPELIPTGPQEQAASRCLSRERPFTDVADERRRFGFFFPLGDESARRAWGADSQTGMGRWHGRSIACDEVPPRTFELGLLAEFRAWPRASGSHGDYQGNSRNAGNFKVENRSPSLAPSGPSISALAKAP